jgi:hypothetical protein
MLSVLGDFSIINMSLWGLSLGLSAHALRIAVEKWRQQGGSAAMPRKAASAVASSV